MEISKTVINKLYEIADINLMETLVIGDIIDNAYFNKIMLLGLPYEKLENGKIVIYRDKTTTYICGLEEQLSLNYVHSLFSMLNYKHVILKNCITKDLDSLYNMFANSEDLRTIRFENMDFSNVEDITNIFRGCTNLESVDFGNTEFGSIKHANSSFYNCKKLNKLDFSVFRNSNFENISNMFYNCEELSNLEDFIEQFNELSLINADNMFVNSGIKTLVLKDLTLNKIVTLNNLFKNCGKLESVYIENCVIHGYSKLAKVELNNMFKNCRNLRKVHIKNLKVDNKETVQLGNIFCSCTALREVVIDGLDIGKCKMTLGMFKGDSILKTLEFKNCRPTKIEDMSEMFLGCKKLKTLDISCFPITEKTRTYNIFKDTDLVYKAPKENGTI